MTQDKSNNSTGNDNTSIPLMTVGINPKGGPGLITLNPNLRTDTIPAQPVITPAPASGPADTSYNENIIKGHDNQVEGLRNSLDGDKNVAKGD